MTALKMFIVPAICAALVVLSALDLHVAFACMPIAIALASVAAAFSLGIRPRPWLISLGAIAGLAGLVLANIAITEHGPMENETYLTNLEYNNMYRWYRIQLGMFALLAVGTGGVTGLVFSKAFGNCYTRNGKT